MSTRVQLDEAFALALKLSPKDRIQLIERLASSVEREIEVDEPHKEQAPPEEHWGKALNQLLDTLDMSDWQAMQIDDPVEWLEQQREAERKQRLGDWGEPQ